MYENLTYERIMSRVLANVPSNVDKRQGSVIYDAVAPVCSEIAQIYVALDNCCYSTERLFGFKGKGNRS